MELVKPSYIQGDNTVRAFKIQKGDIVEYTLKEFLKPMNINMFMHNHFKVIGYGSRRDYWLVGMFGKKYKRIPNPFKKIKTVKLEYMGEDNE